MKRKLFSILSLILVLACVFVIPASAIEEGPEEPVDPDEPYVDIATFSVGCTINGSGLATCSSSVLTAHSNYTVYLTVSLQRYNSNSGYWQQYVGPWYSSGVRFASVYQQYYVPHGYYYRTAAAATVYDSNGNYVESATIYSANRYY